MPNDLQSDLSRLVARIEREDAPLAAADPPAALPDLARCIEQSLGCFVVFQASETISGPMPSPFTTAIL